MSSKLSLGLSLCCILFIINIHGRSISEWSIDTDPSIINECLKKSVRYINRHEESELQSQDATNVVLTSHINNGYNFKLTFDIGGKHWECKLYKSLVQVLSAKLEECVQTSPENEQEPSHHEIDDDIDNDEKQIDELNQAQQAANNDIDAEKNDKGTADESNVLLNQENNNNQSEEEDKEEDDEDIVGKSNVPSNQENNSNQPEEEDEVEDEQDDEDIADKLNGSLKQENNNNQPEEDKEEDDEEIADKLNVQLNQENSSKQPEEVKEEDDEDIVGKSNVPSNQENNNNQPEEEDEVEDEQDDEDDIDRLNDALKQDKDIAQSEKNDNNNTSDNPKADQDIEKEPEEDNDDDK